MTCWYWFLSSEKIQRFRSLWFCQDSKDFLYFQFDRMSENMILCVCVCVLEDKEAALVLVSRCEDETVLELPTLRSRERLSLRSSFH
jgi:hypothetical protein